MKLPQRLHRKAIKEQLRKLSAATWDYLFDHEKENGLYECRTESWNEKVLCYDTEKLKQWLIDRCYYLPADFDGRVARVPGKWSALMATS